MAGTTKSRHKHYSDDATSVSPIDFNQEVTFIEDLESRCDQIESKIIYGNGSPEGLVTGNIGVLYINKDGGAGTTLYVKEVGVGNTGWSAK